jgi:glycyl-tRNA synthetase beta chain
MSTTTRNLLVELFVEELPPKALKKLGEAFARELAESLRSQSLLGADAVTTSFASPRRLAAHITNVVSVAPDQEVVTKLMPRSVALDGDGNPTDAMRKLLAR